jgi:hypothetical protein
MNERIKELVLKSGGLSYDDDNTPMPYMLIGNAVEEFAKRIIKECVSLQYTNVIVGSVSEYNRGRREFAEDILKHFGVEK